MQKISADSKRGKTTATLHTRLLWIQTPSTDAVWEDMRGLNAETRRGGHKNLAEKEERSANTKKKDESLLNKKPSTAETQHATRLLRLQDEIE
jgi:hypothetical protein